MTGSRGRGASRGRRAGTNGIASGRARRSTMPFADAARSVLLIDTMVMAGRLSPYAPESGYVAPSLDVSVHFHDQAPDADWLLCEATAPIARARPDRRARPRLVAGRQAARLRRRPAALPSSASALTERRLRARFRRGRPQLRRRRLVRAGAHAGEIRVDARARRRASGRSRTSRPPTTAMPSDWRLPAAPPSESAIGRMPKHGRERWSSGSAAGARAAASSTASRAREAALAALVGELDDQDAVLRHQADQHDDADLAEDVERLAEEQQRDERARERERHGDEDDRSDRGSSRTAPRASGRSARARARRRRAGSSRRRRSRATGRRGWCGSSGGSTLARDLVERGDAVAERRRPARGRPRSSPT